MDPLCSGWPLVLLNRQTERAGASLWRIHGRNVKQQCVFIEIRMSEKGAEGKNVENKEEERQLKGARGKNPTLQC